jgi:hypothetical protein
MVTEGAAPIETVDRSIDSSRTEVRRLSKKKVGRGGGVRGQVRYQFLARVISWNFDSFIS